MSDLKVSSWVMLFEHINYGGQHLTKLYKENVTNMNDATTDDGVKGFNDKASSVMCCIAVGTKCRLWEHADFKGDYKDLIGKGTLEKVDLKELGFNDKVSSLEWVGIAD